MARKYTIVVANGPHEGTPVRDALLIWHGEGVWGRRLAC